MRGGRRCWGDEGDIVKESLPSTSHTFPSVVLKLAAHPKVLEDHVHNKDRVSHSIDHVDVGRRKDLLCVVLFRKRSWCFGDCAFTARTRDVEDVIVVRSWVTVERCYLLSFLPKDGERMLIKAAANQDFHQLRRDMASLFERWFLYIEPWDPSYVSPEIMVWLRCYGIQIHAWKQCSFLT
ncbi:hypothetical protein RIF29_05389 [Crotalaria pallida]|uniref:Uncharacterized protein n=1 Tax=Crotalaria pallida TaxID=3830 RepID=A0AAN9J1Z4_CROPI